MRAKEKLFGYFYVITQSKRTQMFMADIFTIQGKE